MTHRQVLQRIHEMTAKVETMELALKLKSGVLVSRSPLKVAGKKIAREKRQITLYTPRRDIADVARSKAVASDPQLAYRRTGKGQAEIDHIQAPAPQSKDDVMKGIGEARSIRSEILPHLDKRRLTTRTAASAYGHESIPTEKLEKHYSSMGFKRDRKQMLKMISGGISSDQLKRYMPMIRPPGQS